MEWIRVHQLSVMLFMSGICGILAVLTALSINLSRARKRILICLELSSMLLLLSDRFAYFYRGDPSELGYWMVRISNFLVYFLTILIAHMTTLYIEDLFQKEGKLSPLPRRLRWCHWLFLIGSTLIVVSQFTGIYYTFDAQNTYHRAPGHLVCYVMPVMISMLQLSALVQHHHVLRPRVSGALMVAIALPVLAAVVQAYDYGVSLTNMTMVGMAIIAFVLSLIDLNEAVMQAKEREIAFLKEEDRKDRERFEQTAQALASAIDAKDRYTHGHSDRVADYARRIAGLAGWSEEECKKIYFAGLLHDVGKIGVPDQIINKDGGLTEAEFEKMKLHTVFGHQILSTIRQSPFLSVAARSHHERYDGHGYPDGLRGEQIPEIARIIAVADAYDAMTSSRSYRAALSQRRVREELAAGMGTQFDPVFAELMLRLIDADTRYDMRQREPDAPSPLRTAEFGGPKAPPSGGKREIL